MATSVSELLYPCYFTLLYFTLPSPTGCSAVRHIAAKTKQTAPLDVGFGVNAALTFYHVADLCAESSSAAALSTVLDEVQHAGPITSVCLSSKSDERYIVCGSADATLSVFDRRLNHRQSLLVGHKDQVLTLVVPLSVSLTDKHGQVKRGT